MPTTLRSFDDLIKNSVNYGPVTRLLGANISASTTAATTSSGYVSCSRAPEPFTVPSVTSPVTGFYCTYADCIPTGGGLIIIGKEVLLGTLTVSGNSYSDGSAMPTIEDPGNPSGATIQSAASIIFAVATAAMTATTPVLTINYTNQAGTTGRSCTLTLPTNAAINSAFLVSPRLQSGDTGIRDLSASGPNGLSISTGSAGTVKLYGILPIAKIPSPVTYIGVAPDVLAQTEPVYKLSAGDTINLYRCGATAAATILYMLSLTPDI